MPDAPLTYTTDSIETFLATVAFDANGLVAAIAQQHDTGEVLMLAWMNADALRATMREGRACYWSRSRRKLWRKGEESGHTQTLRDLRVDCDGDTLLLAVEQTGAACHTGRHNCFFRAIRDGVVAEIHPVVVDMSTAHD